MFTVREKKAGLRHDAALASCQGKYSPAFEGPWLGAPVRSRCRGHGNKILSELANAVLFFCLRGGEERNSPGALLCCGCCGTSFNKRIRGRERRREGDGGKAGRGSGRPRRRQPVLVCSTCCQGGVERRQKDGQAYKSRCKSNSPQSKPALRRGLTVPSAPSAAAPRSQAHQHGRRHPGERRTSCNATSELDNHGRKKGKQLAHQQRQPWETIFLLAKRCRSLFSECTSREMQLLPLWF